MKVGFNDIMLTIVITSNQRMINILMKAGWNSIMEKPLHHHEACEEAVVQCSMAVAHHETPKLGSVQLAALLQIGKILLLSSKLM